MESFMMAFMTVSLLLIFLILLLISTPWRARRFTIGNIAAVYVPDTDEASQKSLLSEEVGNDEK